MARPNLILAGVQKCGTTSVFYHLSRHPQVHPGGRKAVMALHGTRLGENEPGPADFAAYEANYAGHQGQAVILDGHGGYLDNGPEWVAAYREWLGPARIVIMLREPASRMVSEYAFRRSRFTLEHYPDFARYLEDSRKYRCGVDNRLLRGRIRGEYDRWLPTWFEAFEDVRVVFFDDLRADTRKVLVDLCDWAGLDGAMFEGEGPLPGQNTSTGFRAAWLHRLAVRVNDGFEVFFRRHPRVKAAVKDTYLWLNGAPKEGARDEALLAELRAEYRPSMARTAALLRAKGYAELPAWLSEAEAGAG